MNKKIKNIIIVLLILNLNISYIYAETNKNSQQQQEEEKISTIKKNKVKTNFTNNLVCSSNYSPIC